MQGFAVGEGPRVVEEVPPTTAPWRIAALRRLSRPRRRAPLRHAFALGAALSAGFPASTGPGHADVSTTIVGPIHVVHPAHQRPRIVDGAGRELLLRGIDVNALVEYGPGYQETVPLTVDDLDEMGALGFDMVRLAVSWSRIMPAPGVLDPVYLTEIAEIARAMSERHLTVVVDMHQDRYNRHLDPGPPPGEVDGAPDWATRTDGVPCTSLGETTLCAQVATQHFWNDDVVAGKPLQAWYLEALVALSRSVRDVPLVAGIELMNEPTPGTILPPLFDQLELFPFYRRMIAGLRADGETRPIWFEPSLLRDVTDDARDEAFPFSTDSNLVYAVHIYTDTFSPPFTPNDPDAHLELSYRNAETEAALYGTPWHDDEFGSSAGGAWDDWLRRQLDLQDTYLVGSGFWLWKQQPHFYDWETVLPDGRLRPDSLRAQILSRPHVDAVPGRLLTTSVRPDHLTVTVDGPGGDALLWGGTVVRHGGASLTSAPLSAAFVDGHQVASRCQRVVYRRVETVLDGCLLSVAVPPGRHRIDVGPADRPAVTVAPPTAPASTPAGTVSALPSTTPESPTTPGAAAAGAAVALIGWSRHRRSRRRSSRVRPARSTAVVPAPLPRP